ncbi:MAG: hypothetical protein VR64_14065 [Desulfatitalea sp. BRH_c12]|nr:MAG: hypothetical protein VR64_14065 [Desulfatitalea sp. BRH_c12]
MLKNVSLVFSILMIVISAEASELDSGQTYYSNYQGKKYASIMPATYLTDSPDFNLHDKSLPKPLSKIIDIAYEQLYKIVDKKLGWSVSNITFSKWEKNDKKWLYAVGFNTTNSSINFDYFTILVTIDGRIGVVKEIQERIIK